MIPFIVLFLLALRPNSFASTPLTSASFNPMIVVQRQHTEHSSNVLGLLSSTFQGPISSPTPRTLFWYPFYVYAHRIGSHVVPPPPPVSPGCSQTCRGPWTKAPFGSTCSCVLPMRVRLLLGLPVSSIFPEVTELEIEVAAGTYLKQSQVAITGVAADHKNIGKAVVSISLLPLEDTFDKTTIFLIYSTLSQKKVRLNKTLFGDYDVLDIRYPGLPGLQPSGTLSGAGPTRSNDIPQHPSAVGLVGKNEKLDHHVIFIISLSALVLLVVCLAAVAVVLHCKKVDLPFNADGPQVITPPMNKRFGECLDFVMQSSSPINSTSVSVFSTMHCSAVQSVKTFALVELEKATKNFSPKHILGEGGFGRVYHGVMENGTEVAVKVLKRDNQNGDHEFITEIVMVSRLHHRNLVKLIGICIEERTHCLVYEFVPNGSIDSHLHGADRSKGPLDWCVRLKIALGAARGLAYLHEDSNPRVIHRDFKASNVLLEDDFTPKVSDFDLAREATEGSEHISTQVVGTFGYVAPEYAMTGHLLVKSDVYSYGVVLLELLTGRKPLDMSQNHGQENLVAWARPLLTNREALEQLVDPTLAGTYNFDDMAKVASIAATCVHLDVTQRPFMGEVVQALKLIKLICNDTNETFGDIYSPEQSSAHYSDPNGDLALSEDNWWNAESVSPRSSRLTMDFGSELGWVGSRHIPLPTRHENRSGPLRGMRSDRDYYRLMGSRSEHRRDLMDDFGN